MGDSQGIFRMWAARSPDMVTYADSLRLLKGVRARDAISNHTRPMAAPPLPQGYAPIRPLGRGAYGEVRALCPSARLTRSSRCGFAPTYPPPSL